MTANTPPLGWNTWNTFGADINEKIILESADAMVSSGLKDAGYEYIVIDDDWALKQRDENGRLVPNPAKFPHGMKYIADYIHKKGLKFGMYSCAGYWTCGGFPASFDYEWIDAKTFAEWEVDYLKYDFCYHPTTVDTDILYKRMGLALANCGRNIIFSACTCGGDETRAWIKETGAHLWRSTGDINDSWASIKWIGQSQIALQEYNGQGCFNDMDMLVVGMNGKGNVGVGGCTTDEYRFHFSLWSLLGSPLMIGCDIRNLTAEAKEILTNREILRIDQDKAYRQPYFLNNTRLAIAGSRGPDSPYWSNINVDSPIIAKFLDDGDVAIGYFNFTDTDSGYDPYFMVDILGLPVTSGKTLEMTDLWTGEKKYPENGVIFFRDIPPHGFRLYRARIIDGK